MIEAKKSFEVSYLEATQQFLPVAIGCQVGGRTATAGEEVEKDVADIHDDID